MRLSQTTSIVLSFFIFAPLFAVGADDCRSLVGVSSANVSPQLPTQKDYSATFEKDGYEIIRDLARPDGMSEAKLYQELKSVFKGDACVGVFWGGNGLFYRAKTRRTAEGEFDGFSMIPISFPKTFEAFLDQRMSYMIDRFPIDQGFYIDRTINIRVGNEQMSSSFHCDGFPGNNLRAVLVESLNLSNESRGTYVVGADGNIFDQQEGDALLFGPSVLHAAPPRVTDRVFIRIFIRSQEYGNFVKDTIYVTEDGQRLVFP